MRISPWLMCLETSIPLTLGHENMPITMGLWVRFWRIFYSLLRDNGQWLWPFWYAFAIPWPVPLEASRASVIMQNLPPWSNRWNLCPRVKPHGRGLYGNKGSHEVELSMGMGPTNSGKAHCWVWKCKDSSWIFFTKKISPIPIERYHWKKQGKKCGLFNYFLKWNAHRSGYSIFWSASQ
jgi:hypothetical protein